MFHGSQFDSICENTNTEDFAEAGNALVISLKYGPKLELVSLCFEPSQLLGVTSGLTKFGSGKWTCM